MKQRKAKKHFFYLTGFSMTRAHKRRLKPIPGYRWVNGNVLVRRK